MLTFDLICYECRKRIGGKLKTDNMPHYGGKFTFHSIKQDDRIIARVLCEDCAAKEQAAEDARYEGEEHADL